MTKKQKQITGVSIIGIVVIISIIGGVLGSQPKKPKNNPFINFKNSSMYQINNDRLFQVNNQNAFVLPKGDTKTWNYKDDETTPVIPDPIFKFKSKTKTKIIHLTGNLKLSYSKTSANFTFNNDITINPGKNSDSDVGNGGRKLISSTENKDLQIEIIILKYSETKNFLLLTCQNKSGTSYKSTLGPLLLNFKY